MFPQSAFIYIITFDSYNNHFREGRQELASLFEWQGRVNQDPESSIHRQVSFHEAT